MATSSLVVRIGANIADFSKELNKMTKDVREAADQIADIGKSMTLGITVPVTLAGVALSHMAMENEAVARKMEQSFGPAAERMNQQLHEMLDIVPETSTALQMFAIKTNDIAKTLGMSSDKASLFSGEILKLAANISATKDVDMETALKSVQSAVMGEVGSLKQLGIAITEAEQKDEAYRLGLLRQGETLTALGKGLASYSLMVKKTAHYQNEATRVQQNAARQWEFLKRDVMEFADVTSNLLLPVLRHIITFARNVVDALNGIPMPVRAGIMIFAGLAASIGPLLIMLAKLTEAIFILRSAMAIMAAGSAITKFVALLTSPKILIAIAAIAVAAGGAIALWQKFGKEVENTEVPKLDGMLDVRDLLGGLTGVSSADPFSNWKKAADAMVAGFEQGIAYGDPVVEMYQRIVDLNREALDIYSQQADKWSDIAVAARDVATRTRSLMAVTQVASGTVRGTMPLRDSIRQASRTLTSQSEVNFNAARALVSEETSTRVREAMMNIANTFDATRMATLTLKEQFRDVSNDFSLGLAKTKAQWGDIGNIGSSAMSGLKSGVTNVLASFTPFALAAAAIGKVMQGLQPVIDALMEPLVVLGQIIGIMLVPILRVLFIPLKYLGIVVAFLGEIVARVSGAIATGIGKLLVGIGNLLNKLPGSIGDPIKRAGESMLGFAKSQYETADQLKRARQDLQAMEFGDTASSLDDLGDAARDAAEQIRGLPDVFKIALSKFNNETPINYGNGGASAAPSANMRTTPVAAYAPTPAGIPDDTKIAQVNLDGRVIANITWGHVRSAALNQFGSVTRVADVARV